MDVIYSRNKKHRFQNTEQAVIDVLTVLLTIRDKSIHRFANFFQYSNQISLQCLLRNAA